MILFLGLLLVCQKVHSKYIKPTQAKNSDIKFTWWCIFVAAVRRYVVKR